MDTTSGTTRITEERVRVERHAVDRPLGADEAAEEGVIEAPEMVTLQKDVRVAEEVEIDKEAVQRTERVGGTVRREGVHVEERVDSAPPSTDEPSPDIAKPKHQHRQRV